MVKIIFTQFDSQCSFSRKRKLLLVDHSDDKSKAYRNEWDKTLA